MAGTLNTQQIAPAGLTGRYEGALKVWRDQDRVHDLWQRRASLWTSGDEAAWLGWLDAVERGRQGLRQIDEIGHDGKAFTHVVVLGMGGSSLAPWVLRQTFGVVAGHPELFVLDSVDPSQILELDQALDITRTLFIVASKSGGTAEPLAFQAHFESRLRAAGISEPERHFIAITDPGTALAQSAGQRKFRHVVYGPPDVGGRFSALTNFGLVPALLMGLEVGDLLDRAELMVRACSADVSAEANPGVALGVFLGTAAAEGRDKLTLAITPSLRAAGSWLEQLVAESTGKMGLGIVPIDGEPLGPPEVYGDDRVFVHIGREGELPAPLEAIKRAGHPVVRIVVHDLMNIGQEFFRWEVATAVAGAVLGLHPFDQPDVEAAKVATRGLMKASERGDVPPAETPRLECEGLRFYADDTNAAALGSTLSPEALLGAHLSRLRPGDYFAINAFLSMHPEHEAELQAIRHRVRDRTKAATTVGYGPRFLHSTGQLHKGGPNNGVFLVLVSDDALDLPVPGTSYTFGAMKRAQALGDCQVLAARHRRLLRVEIGGDIRLGLRRLREWIEAALAQRMQ
jgi:transaldolase/glucose-6-phosphate isomerase